MKQLSMIGLFLLAAIFFLTGCDSLRTIRGTGDITAETREVSDFSAINLAGIGNVVVDFGDREGLRIEAEDNLLPYLESEVKENTLTLGVREGVNIIPTQAIFYYLTVRELDEVVVSGLGNVDIPRLNGSKAAVKVTGGGNINIEELYANALNVMISGLGDLNIDSGEVARQTINISGGGNYNAGELASDETSITISGLGSAGVWARDTLDAKISGGGSVNYNGRPQVTKEISGLGEVKQVGE